MSITAFISRQFWRLIFCLSITSFLFNMFTNCFAQSKGLGSTSSDLPGDGFFTRFFNNHPGKFDSILLHKLGWKVQIIYTQVDRAPGKQPVFSHQYFNVDTSNYFYPSSTIALPLAVLALQKLHDLETYGVNLNSSMITEAASDGQTPVYNDPRSPGGRPTLGAYIRQALSGSSESIDRLYEFLGPKYINEEMLRRGYRGIQVLHRLRDEGLVNPKEATNPVNFYDERKKLIYAQPPANGAGRYTKRNDYVGQGYFADSGFVSSPMNFSMKNRIPLEEAHSLLQGLVFPGTLQAKERFNLTSADRDFLLRCLGTESADGDSSFHNADAYTKYILFGGSPGLVSPSISAFNCSGAGLGQLTDVAYVVDFEKKIEFFLSATIYCNRDEVLNDDEYDYEAIGTRFLQDLGKALYEYELKRPRKNIPDLSGVIFPNNK